MEAYGREVEEELSTLATQYWAEKSLDGEMEPRTKRSMDEANSGGTILEAGKRTCRGSFCARRVIWVTSGRTGTH